MPGNKRMSKKSYKKRGGKRKTYAMGRVTTRSLMPNVMNFKRKQYWGVLTPDQATTAGFWKTWYYRLDQMNNYTEITALFDQYKINAIKLTFVPRFTDAPAASNNYTQPRMLICYDKYSTVASSSRAPTGTYSSGTLNNFLEQGKIKTVRKTYDFPIQLYIPRPTVETDIGGSIVERFKAAPWLPTTAANVTHNLCNTFHHTPNFSSTDYMGQWDIYLTWYISCRNSK